MQHVLSADLQDQLAKGRQLLAEIRDALTRFGANGADQTALARSIRQLDDFFLLVVVGEFNAGKSAFVNALIGEQVLQEGVTPTTAAIHLLKYGDQVGQEAGDDGVRLITAPADLLRDVHIVDTPGTNAVMREHERLTADFVPRADLVLFVTSADRPFTETERAFLETIRGWGKKIVVVINKVDIFERPADVEEVVGFVRASAARLLGLTPEIFPVSARLALRAKRGAPASWAASGFEPLESFIAGTLHESTRFRLKLANPLGVGQALAHRYATVAEERLTLLDDDVMVLDQIEGQLAVYTADLARGFELRMTAVEKVLVDMEARGHQYFEDTLRLGRVVDLLNRARIQKEFEERVVADAPRQIERRVAELIDWLIDQDFRQWQAVTTTVASRVRNHASAALGAPDVGTFHADRARMIDHVGREAQRVVDTYDKQREAEAIAEQARAAVTTAAAAGGAALGLGHAGHPRGVHGGGRRYRHPPGGRRGGARFPGHSRPGAERRRRRCSRRSRRCVNGCPPPFDWSSSGRATTAADASSRRSPPTAGSSVPSTRGGATPVARSHGCGIGPAPSGSASLHKEGVGHGRAN